MTTLRDMIRKAKPKKIYPETIPDFNEDRYPWGLRINLNDEELDKLDIDLKKISIDDKIKIEAVAYVESLRSSKSRTGEDRNLELQITEMAISKTKVT